MVRFVATILLLLLGAGAMGGRSAHAKSRDGELAWIFVRESVFNAVSIASVIRSLVAAKGSHFAIRERMTS